MKYWWHNVVKNYLTFTKRERINLLAVFALLGLIYFLPDIFKKKKEPLPKSTFQQELAQLKIQIDTASNQYAPRYTKYNKGDDEFSQPSRPYYDSKPKGELFEFDPNTLSAAGFKKLGLRDKTVSIIENFRAKGYTFRKPEDIKKIYGLRPEEADRILPYIKIENKSTFTAAVYTGNASNYTGNVSTNPIKESKPSVAKLSLIDINNADTTALIALPGIGSRLAFRIINFRDKLGGFYSVDQVGETYALPDSTFQKIKSRLVCSNPSVTKININTADVNQLKSHPYFKWNVANAIVNYRQQHGNYNSLEDILKIELVTDDLFKKVKPYLAL